MVDYYQTIILPARVRKPKDKPSVENGVLISSRKILAKLRNKQIYSTVKEHMPPAKTFFTDWNGEHFLEWAKKCGPETQAVVQAILDSAAIEQQAYRSCFGLLALTQLAL